MSLQLLVLSWPDKGKMFTLNTGRDLMLGCSANARYGRSDPRVSSTHCQILLQGDDIVVRCNGGSGGTIVNGKKTRSTTSSPMTCSRSTKTCERPLHPV
jgi:hypothetical protein